MFIRNVPLRQLAERSGAFHLTDEACDRLRALAEQWMCDTVAHTGQTGSDVDDDVERYHALRVDPAYGEVFARKWWVLQGHEDQTRPQAVPLRSSPTHEKKNKHGRSPDRRSQTSTDDSERSGSEPDSESVSEPDSETEESTVQGARHIVTRSETQRLVQRKTTA
jgi:hypothetical protein